MSILDDILESMGRMDKGETEEEEQRKKQQARPPPAPKAAPNGLAQRFETANPYHLLSLEEEEEEAVVSGEARNAVRKKKRKNSKTTEPSLSESVLIVKRKKRNNSNAMPPVVVPSLAPPESPVSKREDETVPSTNDVVIVSQIDECKCMVEELSKLQVIAVDCEGVNLSREGELCLVQIGTNNKVYLVDVLEHGRSLFEEGGLRALLESNEVRKVLHDCRGDSDALYHQYGVKLQNVFDTQVAYAVIKRQIGQGTPLPVGLNTLLRIYATPILEIRASKEKEMAELQKQRAQASGEEEPAAPGDLVRRLDAINTFKKEERLKMTEDLNYWKNRPLTPSMIGYASEDVMFLSLVYQQMHASLDVHNRKIAMEFSSKYVGQVRDLASLSERPVFDGVPKYGFSSWDSETARSLALSKARGPRRRGR